MHRWTIIEKVYLYDGTLEGLLTIAYDSLKLKQIPKYLFEEDKYLPNLIDETISIETNIEKSSKLLKMLDNISKRITYKIFKAHLADNPNKSKYILQYIIASFKYGKSLIFRKSMDCVIKIDEINKKVGFEALRMEEFVRFKELSNGILYSEIEPDNNILQLIANHFKNRYMMIPWIINDLKRNIALIYDTKQITILDSTNLDITKLENCEEETKYEDMWKMFFKTIAIKERTNKRCQLNLMPKRYWKHMLEVKGE